MYLDRFLDNCFACNAVIICEYTYIENSKEEIDVWIGTVTFQKVKKQREKLYTS